MGCAAEAAAVVEQGSSHDGTLMPAGEKSEEERKKRKMKKW